MLKTYGGETGIRTLGTLTRTPVFKTGALNQLDHLSKILYFRFRRLGRQRPRRANYIAKPTACQGKRQGRKHCHAAFSVHSLFRGIFLRAAGELRFYFSASLIPEARPASP